MARFPLPVHSYALRSKPASAARLVNCFPEPLPPDAKSAALLTRAPGIRSWVTVGIGPIALMHPALGNLFVVSGSELYSVTPGKVVTLLGAVGNPGNLDMDSNAASVVVVNEPRAYHWSGPGIFGQITDGDFVSRGAGDVEFLDNFLLFREPGSGRFFGSDLGSTTDYSALSFATAEGSPDNLKGLKVDHRQVLLFGETSVEIWENTGTAGFPFERSINGFVELGCLNGRTIAKIDNSVFWLANDFTVRRLDGVNPVRVSTHSIEQKLERMTLSSAKGHTYTQEGHLFYFLTFTEGSFLYDVTTSTPGNHLWHERETYGETAWNWGTPVSFGGKILVGSTTSNVVGDLDPSVYTDLGGTQRMEWTYQTVYAEQQRAFHDRLEMVFEAGTGTTGQGVDPLVMLDYSDDGGQRWKSLPSKRLGRIGEYEQRCVWQSIGAARQRVYRAAVSDPVSVTLMDTFIEVRGGRI